MEPFDAPKDILIVDDEADIRDVLGISLADIGYRVHTAENGAQALRLFKKITPAIVLTDIKMPGMDGIELLRKIKQQNPETEVIMITGHGDMDLAIESFKDEASDFITKPINIETLEIALQRAQEKIVIRQKLRDYTESLEELVFEKSARLAAARAGDTAGQGPMVPAPRSESLRHIFDELPCYITVQDQALKIAATNRVFREEFGDEIGRPCYAVLKQREDPCPDCPVAKTFVDGKTYQAEMEFKPAGAKPLNVLVWTAPIRDAQGAITHVMLMSTNITQVSELHNQLSSLGLVLGSVSHGIKGLLTGLDGGVYILDSGLARENQEQVQEGLEIVKQMVVRIRKMVLDVLFYAKERELKKEEIAVADFAGDVASVVASKMKNSNIEFVCELDPSLGAFEVDVGFLRSALINILENALDACVEDTSKPAHRIAFSIKPQDGDIIFDVHDNGIGMDQETLGKMFTLFFSAKGKKGTGLGLFIANKVVLQHGGAIAADSTPGQGTQIRVRIPKNKPLPGDATP